MTLKTAASELVKNAYPIDYGAQIGVEADDLYALRRALEEDVTQDQGELAAILHAWAGALGLTWSREFAADVVRIVLTSSTRKVST